MRIALVSFVSAAVLLAGCGANAPEEPAAGDAAPAADVVAAAEPADPAPAEPARRALANPLPGGVVPDFDYSTTVDMSTQVGVTIRQIHLDVAELSAAEAMDRLVAQFESAGLESNERGSQGGTLVQSVWIPGEGGVTGMAAVNAGGTHVALIATDYEADHSRRDDGYVSALRLQVNSK